MTSLGESLSLRCANSLLNFSSRSFAFSHVLQTRRRLYLRHNAGDSTTVIEYMAFHGGDHIHRSQDTDSACTELDCTTYSDWASVLVCSVFRLYRVTQVDLSGCCIHSADSPSICNESSLNEPAPFHTLTSACMCVVCSQPNRKKLEHKYT